MLGAACCVVIGLIGCSLLLESRPARFSHRMHEEQKIACGACHEGGVTDATAEMPTFRHCLACHGEDESRAPYPYETEIQKQDPSQTFLPRVVSTDLKFSHAVHSARDVPCAACHGALLADSTRWHLKDNRPEACQDCHRQHDVAADCSVCHLEIRTTTKPPSHHSDIFLRTHGRDIEIARSRGHQEGCGICHAQSSCDACHQIMKPQSHTEFFRGRGHGLEAGLNRTQCTPCHQENFCVRCHQEVEPRSHVGGFGGAQSRHCLSCHEPLESTGCRVCHASTLSHQLATPIPPPPHQPATSDCRRCHLRPPHADNGSDCTLCHK